MSANRRGSVAQSGVQLQLFIYETQLGANDQIPRPVWGNAVAGLHYQPSVGDEVIALAEVAGWNTTVVPATLWQNLTTVMQPGETAILASDGRQAPYLAADGSTQIYFKPSGASISISTAQNMTVTVPTAGVITLNATTTGTLTFTGAATFNQSLTVTGTTTLAATTVTSLNAGSGTIQTTGNISGGTLTVTTSSSLAAATATSLNAGSGTVQTTGALQGGSATITGATTLQGPIKTSTGGTAPSVSTSLAGGSVSLSGSDRSGIVTLTCTGISGSSGLLVCTLTFATAYTTKPHVFLSWDFASTTGYSVITGYQVEYLGSGASWTGFNLRYAYNSTFNGLVFHYFVVQ